MPDPDLEIRGRGWGEGGGGSVPKKFFGIFGPQFGLNIRGGGVGPSPGSANEQEGFWITLQVCHKAHDLFSCSPVLLSPGTD